MQMWMWEKLAVRPIKMMNTVVKQPRQWIRFWHPCIVSVNGDQFQRPVQRRHGVRRGVTGSSGPKNAISGNVTGVTIFFYFKLLLTYLDTVATDCCVVVSWHHTITLETCRHQHLWASFIGSLCRKHSHARMLMSAYKHCGHDVH